MFVVYNILLTLGSLFWVPWMLFRAAQRKEPPNWKERQGDFEITPRKDRKRVWIHAVSVGEVIAAIPILRELRLELPDHQVVLTTTTSSGYRTAKESAGGLFDHLFYFPIDVARFQLAAMQRVQPSVVAIMETELWMNFLWAAKIFDAKTMLVNGRISDRSYRRSRVFRFFFKALLKDVDRCLMQTQADADRIIALGARSAEVFGNTKFDQAMPPTESEPVDWRQELGLQGSAPLVVVGSTRGEFEEAFVLEALRIVGLDEIAVVHAPRHIERAEALASAYRSAGAKVGLRSDKTGGSVIVLDSYGELDKVYEAADVVVIGGGFEKLGGQNLIQALARGKPVLHGPHMSNFREVARTADEAGAARACSTPAELATAISELLQDSGKRAFMGLEAKAIVERNLGAAHAYAAAIAEEALSFTP